MSEKKKFVEIVKKKVFENVKKCFLKFVRKILFFWILEKNISLNIWEFRKIFSNLLCDDSVPLFTKYKGMCLNQDITGRDFDRKNVE